MERGFTRSQKAFIKKMERRFGTNFSITKMSSRSKIIHAAIMVDGKLSDFVPVPNGSENEVYNELCKLAKVRR